MVMSFINWLVSTWHSLASQPSAPSTLILTSLIAGILVFAVIAAVFFVEGPEQIVDGVKVPIPIAERLFRFYTRLGRLRSLFCSPCDRVRKRYPLANTCQIPHFKDLSDIYNFVFGYRTEGLFVEVGAYDGESFSNTSCLADLGWRGHYLEPVPQYAAACRHRHASNPKVMVHNVCAGETDGVQVSLSAAGPFSSAVDDEIASVANSKLASVLTSLGWNPGQSVTTKVNTVSVSLNTFFKEQKIGAGEVDVMVVDVEGFEWPIFKGFDLQSWRPKLVIVEIQEKQARYAENERAQQDATHIEKYFHNAGYSIFYRDVINTIFIAKEVRCVGGD